MITPTVYGKLVPGLRAAAYSPVGQALIGAGKAKVNSLLSDFRNAKAKISAAALVKNTPLGSYLDKKYEKKCGVEVKQRDTIGALALPLALGDFGPAFYFNMNIAQGTTDVTRIGNSIETKSLALKMSVYSNVLVGGASTRVKILLVRTTDPNGAPLTANQILQVVGNMRSPPALDRSETFKVIKEWDFTLSPQGAEGDQKWLTFYHNPKSCEVTKWNQADVAGLQANNIKGLYQMFGMYQGAVAPTLDLYCRFSYVDI